MKLGQKLAVNYLRARLNLLAVISPQRAAKKAFNIFCTPFYRSKKEFPPVFKQAEKHTISLHGITLQGFKWNRGGSKRVLILHGFESSCRNFDAYIKALIQKGYEVIAFDAPAHGSSGGKQITLPLYIEAITAVHFKFGGIQSFIAHSFGGLAVTHFLEKIPTADTSLALIAPATETNTAINSFFKFLQLGQNVRTEFEKIIEEKSGHPAGYFSIPRALQNIQSNVLWVHDEDDDITPIKDVEPLMQEPNPHLSFMITRGLGHKKIYRDNKVIRAVVDFL
ncbi:MAG: alpha/beta hydrolase [Chitinophagaceae bacterium]